ncbi:MAG: hypothetical protein JXB88_18455 [Spirochaetales bacterium]|nr:hypothetical protein [Spirochaetales bacterium]
MKPLIPVLILLGLIIPVSLGYGVDAYVVQFDWVLSAGGKIVNSRVGEARFTVTPGDIKYIQENNGAFINMAIDCDAVPGPIWIVQNMYVPNDDTLPEIQTGAMFGMGSSGNSWENAFISVILSDEPFDFGSHLSSCTCTLFSATSIIHEDYLTGGMDGGSGDSSIPAVITVWKGFDADADATDWTPVSIGIVSSEGSIPAIDEGPNECAPAAIARSIAYMASLNDEPVDSPQDIKDDLADEMGTTSSGTQKNNIIPGKNDYTDSEDLPVDSSESTNIDTAINTLNNGGDVEIMISWTGGGGHAAMVVKIVKYADGSASITFVDDASQGNNQANNDSHTIHVNPDGSFEHGEIIGFIIESWNPPTPTPTSTSTSTPFVPTATPTPTP